MSDKRKIIFRLIILVGIIIRLVILFLPFDVILERWGSDDLFYYSQIAGKFWETGQFTFDGLELTNGFQPLFMILLIPFGKFTLNNPQSSLIIVLSLTSVLTILASLQIPKLFKAYNLDSRLALVATGLFLFHPKILSVTFNGTEASLSFLMVFLSLLAFKWVQDGKKLVISSLIFTGLILTRMDFSILLFLLFVISLIQRHSFFLWVKVLLLPTIFFALWLFINYHFFDSIVPSSGTAKKLHSGAFDIEYLRQWMSTYSTAMMSESRLSITILLLSGIGLFSIFKLKTKQYKYIIFFLFILSAISGIIPILSIGSFRDWYLIIHFILILFISSLGIYFLLNKTRFKIGVSLLILLGVWTEAQFSQRNLQGTKVIASAIQFEEIIEQNEVIGSFNSGLINTTLGNRRVVNIDGVVNNGILEYYQNKNIDLYLKKQNIRYIIDYKNSIDFFLENFSTQQNFRIVDLVIIGKEEFVLVELL